MVNRRGAGGQSMVEFAMVIPFFLLLLFGLIDFSRLLFTYVSLTNGARELARNLAFSTSTASTSTAAFNNLTLIGGSTQPATSVTVALSVGGGNGSLTCARSNPLLCAIGVTTSSTGTVTMTNLTSGGSTSFSATTASNELTATGNGDFVTEAWVALDGSGWPQ